MLATIRDRAKHLLYRLRYLYLPPATVGPVLMSREPFPTDLGIEILNDDRTRMEFVVRVLESCFWMNRPNAIDAMIEIHNSGGTFLGYIERGRAQILVEHVTNLARKNGFPLECRVVQPGEHSPFRSRRSE